MAYTTIIFEHPQTGRMREAPVGFSWTVLFFGFFPPMFRGDWKYAIVMFLIALVTFGLSHFVFIFIYNRIYIKDLVGEGYKAKSIGSGNMNEASAKVGFKIPMLQKSKPKFDDAQ